MRKFGNAILLVIVILICSIYLVGCVNPSSGGNNDNGNNIGGGGNDTDDGEDTDPGEHTCITSGWVVFAATCMDSGRRERTCTECGEILAQEFLPIDSSQHRPDCSVMECGHHTSTDKVHKSYNNKECSGYHLSCYEGTHSAEICGSKMLYYEEIDGGLAVSNNGNTSTTIYIPSMHNGKSVTKISDKAFEKNVSLTSLFIADTVIEIGDNAFSFCKQLVQVNFGKVEVIGGHAFEYTGLVNAALPTTVVKIGSHAFYNCNSLVSMTLPIISREKGKDYFGYIFGAQSYMTNRTYVPQSLKTVYLIGNNISLTEFSFYNCTGIENIYFSGIASVSDNALISCANTLELHVTNCTSAPSNWGKLWNRMGLDSTRIFVTEWDCVCKWSGIS